MCSAWAAEKQPKSNKIWLTLSEYTNYTVQTKRREKERPKNSERNQKLHIIIILYLSLKWLSSPFLLWLLRGSLYCCCRWAYDNFVFFISTGKNREYIVLYIVNFCFFYSFDHVIVYVNNLRKLKIFVFFFVLLHFKLENRYMCRCRYLLYVCFLLLFFFPPLFICYYSWLLALIKKLFHFNGMESKVEKS